ncbi:MAG: COX15/CtaA family protein [Geminicoccaceae bacterium]|nr:COX15/CtaA family protein [Geminicoccaceae bacterium]MDW8368890.1 COX15/CtaA family protein [Geminicoccaceae bacterium]
MIAIRRLAVATAILAYALIVLGALVRSTNSGLSCPDWPTCYGYWVLTPADFAALPYTGYTYGQVMLEWVHRLIAGVFLGPLVLVLLALIVWWRRERPGLLAAGGLLLALLIVQKLLGGVTVLDRNSPWSVALHLGNAMLVLATLLWIAVRASDIARVTVPTGLAGLTAATWFLVIGAITSAAIVAKSGAALACSSWPLCDGALIPDLADPLIRANFTHRVLAGLAAAALVLLAWQVGRAGLPAGLVRLARFAAILVLIEVVLGAVTVWGEIATALAVLHQAVGVLVFAKLTLFWWRLRAAAQPVAVEAGNGLALRGA